METAEGFEEIETCDVRRDNLTVEKSDKYMDALKERRIYKLKNIKEETNYVIY